MPRYGFTEYKSFKKFLGDQWIFVVPFSLIGMWFFLVYLLGVSPSGLLFLMELIGGAVLVVLLSIAVVTLGCLVIWTFMCANELKELPGANRKLKRLTCRERLGRYFDFRGFD